MSQCIAKNQRKKRKKFGRIESNLNIEKPITLETLDEGEMKKNRGET